MASPNKYGLSSTAIEEWIPWGGIVVPFIMRQKDGSLFSVIRYRRYTIEDGAEQETIPFRRGWVLWNEHQYSTASEDHEHDYLVICWNPFIVKSSSYIGNSLYDKVKVTESIEAFGQDVERLLATIRQYTEAQLLEYQELMDFLSFTVSFGDDHADMPDVPLYMDALLTQNIDFGFGTNDITINDKKLLVISLNTPLDCEELYSKLTAVNFRHTRRLELFSDKEAQKDLRKYTNKWFSGRKVLRDMALNDLLGRYNGYYSEVLLFLIEKANYDDFLAEISAYLDATQSAYIVEDYNLKEVFWGSIPGLYLANARPPLVGFRMLAELLNTTIRKKEVAQITLEKREQTITERELQQELEGGTAFVSP